MPKRMPMNDALMLPKPATAMPAAMPMPKAPAKSHPANNLGKFLHPKKAR